MPNPYTSILVVDDAKFSTTVISKTLKVGGYANVRHAGSALEAITIHDHDPASIVIVDWLMPGMDGIELLHKIRQMDEADNRYTYVIMLTAKDGVDALKHAFEEGVDDFVNKATMTEQLLPRIFAAERLVDNQNRILKQHQDLINANRTLQELCTLDPLTGLGNASQALARTYDTLKYTESRGGATCMLLLEIRDGHSLPRMYRRHAYDEVLVALSRRLRGLVRPLDYVARVSEHRFAVITHQPDIAQCSGQAYRRILDGINLRAFKTSAGFLSLQVGISLAAACAEFGLPDAEQLFRIAENKLPEAHNAGRIVESYFKSN